MKTVIEMAQEAGGYFAELPNADAWLFDDEKLLASFVALVRADEREACAKVCERIEELSAGVDDPPAYIYYEAIRSRGNK